MYSFARPAVRKHHKLSGLNNRNLSHSSGDQKSEIKRSIGLVPSEVSEGESVHAFFLASGSSLAIFGGP